MFPGPTELFLIVWSNNLGPKNPNQVHRHQKTNLPTFLARETSRVTNGIIFCVCSTRANFSSGECSGVVSKRTQIESGEERVTAKSNQWWIWSLKKNASQMLDSFLYMQRFGTRQWSFLGLGSEKVVFYQYRKSTRWMGSWKTVDTLCSGFGND